MALKRALALSLLALVATAGVVLATHQPVGVTSTALPAGTLDRSDRVEFLSALAGQGRYGSTKVLTVTAGIEPNGTTDWHGHPGPSVVVVTKGTLTVTYSTGSGRCATEPWVEGQAYFHTDSPHTFQNLGSAKAEFYVMYFVSSLPALTHPVTPCTP